MKKILSQQIARGISCFTLDPEGEYDELYRNLGGTAINCASGKFLINPFEIRKLKTGDDTAEELENEIEALHKDQSLFQYLSWLKDFYKVPFPDLKDLQFTALSTLTQDMYIRHGIDHNTDLSKRTSKDYPTFTDLHQYISDVLDDRQKYGFYKEILDDMISGGYGTLSTTRTWPEEERLVL